MAVATYEPGVLVSTEGLPEEEWLEWRRKGIGGSDASIVLGVSPFATARDLYFDKLKIVSYKDDSGNWVALKIGHLLEDLVAEIFHKKTGYPIYQIKKMFYNPLLFHQQSRKRRAGHRMERNRRQFLLRSLKWKILKKS